MRTCTLGALAVLFCVLCPATNLYAANDNPSSPKPTGVNLQYGFEGRIRSENWNNVADYSNQADDERRQIRFRSRAWVTTSNDRFEFSVKLANEFKKQPTPEIKFNSDEVFVENLYLELKKTPIRGVSVRVGRQDIIRGEGFVLFDGTSNDGSRSFYFNAVNVTWEHKKSKLELLGILNPARDRFFPLLHSQHKNVTEWDEQAVGAYYTDRNDKNTDVDAYYFLKKEVHDFRAPSNPQFQPDRHVSTLGARVVRRFGKGVLAAGEFAGQWGADKLGTQISGWGGYGYVKKTFSHKLKPYIQGGVWALSGDDPNTHDKYEGFDPLFSRGPKWSDLYIYSLVGERGVSYLTNDRLLQAEAGLTPWKPITLRTALYRNDAFHPFTTGKQTVFANGTHRGENFYVRMDYRVTPNIKGHIQYENMAPGNFYKADSRAYFFRAEIIYQFTGSTTLGGRKTQ